MQLDFKVDASQQSVSLPSIYKTAPTHWYQIRGLGFVGEKNPCELLNVTMESTSGWNVRLAYLFVHQTTPLMDGQN